jgi:hypothetical protein
MRKVDIEIVKERTHIETPPFNVPIALGAQALVSENK